MELFVYSEVEKFLNTLSNEDNAKAKRSLSLLRMYGRLLSPPDSKKISADIFELRVKASVQIRLLYGFAKDRTVVVHGFVKKSQKLSPRELRLAQDRFEQLA